MLSFSLRLTHSWQPLTRNSALVIASYSSWFPGLKPAIMNNRTLCSGTDDDEDNESDEQSLSHVPRRRYSQDDARKVVALFKEREYILRKAASDYGLEGMVYRDSSCAHSSTT